MAIDILWQIFLQSVESQVTATFIACQDALPLKETGNPVTDLVWQAIALSYCRELSAAEAISTTIGMKLHSDFRSIGEQQIEFPAKDGDQHLQSTA
ncbi:MAG: hypothetical protein ACI95C_001503 [Pseudohongiellaceae bacterium]